MKTNYNEIMKEIIESNTGVKKLLLHSCCGPCSTAVIDRLTKYFDITVFYYNPNIEPKEEYEKRKQEQIRFINEYKGINKVDYLDCDYDNKAYEDAIIGLEKEPEGGIRCHKCYELRLLKTANKAKELGYDYFTTTLTVSPYKDSQIINQIAKKIEDKIKVKYLYSDFKKEDGYKRSIDLAKEHDLYRQNYCGCQYSYYVGIDE